MPLRNSINIWVLLLGTLFFAASVHINGELYAVDDWRGVTLPAKEVARRWGYIKFDAQKFQTGNLMVRSKMAAALLETNPFHGKSLDQVIKILGQPDGLFMSEKILAYLIEDPRDRKKTTWQIVFFPDNKDLISEVFVQQLGSERKTKVFKEYRDDLLKEKH